MKRFLSIVLCLVIAFVSCDNEQQHTILGSGFTLSIDPSQRLEFSPVGETMDFTLTVSEPLNIERRANWLGLAIDGKSFTQYEVIRTLDPGCYTVTLTAPCAIAVTPSGGYRSNSILLYPISYEDKAIELYVYQEYPYLYFENNPGTVCQWNWAQRYHNAERSFNIKSNIKWKVSSVDTRKPSNVIASSIDDSEIGLDAATRTEKLGAYWLTNVLSGEGDAEFKLGPNAFNYGDSPIETTITISADAVKTLDNTIPPLTLVCEQSNLQFVIYQKDSNGVYQEIANNQSLLAAVEPCSPDPIDIKIESEGGLSWSSSFDSSWAYLTEENGSVVTGDKNVTSSGSDELRVCINTNDSRIKRNIVASFNVRTGDASAVRKFKIEQKPFVHELVDDNSNAVTKVIARNSGDLFNAESIFFRSSGSWSGSVVYGSSTENWLTVSPLSGNVATDGEEINIGILGRNPELNERTATITFKSNENNLDSKLVVEQNPFIFELGSGETSVVLKKDDTSEKDIIVKTSGEWSASSDQSWLTVTPSGQASELGVAVKYKATTNTGADERQAKIVIKSLFHENNGYTNFYAPIEVLVKQHGSFVVDKAGETLTFGSLSNLEYNVNVECLATDGWRIKSKPSWIKTSSDSSKASVATVKLTADKNTSYTSRSGVVEFAAFDSNENVEKVRTVAVQQDAYTFTVDVKGFGQSVIPAYNSDGYICYVVDVNCSGQWKASVTTGAVLSRYSSYNSLHPQEIAFGESDHLYVFVKNNSQDAVRNITLTITCDGDSASGHNPLTFVAEQQAYVFNVDKTAVEAAAELIAGDITTTFTVTCSGRWEVDLGIYASWIQCTPSSGENANKATVTMTISPNSTRNTRYGTVRIKSSDNSNMTHLINITQQSIVFDPITPSSLTFVAEPTAAQTVNIKCSGSWVYDKTKSEIKATVTPESGFGNATVSILPEPNTTSARLSNKKLYFTNTLTGQSQYVNITMEKNSSK